MKRSGSARTAVTRFDEAYGRVWLALQRGDDTDLSQQERDLLHHVPAPGGGVPLGTLARHLALPMSSASVLVKDMERRGFLRRRRDKADERRLAIVLTPKGQRRVAADTVLRPDALADALGLLSEPEREALVAGLDRLAEVAVSMWVGERRRA